jgi:hypothetical protein
MRAHSLLEVEVPFIAINCVNLIRQNFGVERSICRLDNVRNLLCYEVIVAYNQRLIGLPFLRICRGNSIVQVGRECSLSPS